MTATRATSSCFRRPCGGHARSYNERSPPEARTMKYLHAMIRVHDLEATSRFFTEGLGLVQPRPARDGTQQRADAAVLA